MLSSAWRSTRGRSGWTDDRHSCRSPAVVVGGSCHRTPRPCSAPNTRSRSRRLRAAGGPVRRHPRAGPPLSIPLYAGAAPPKPDLSRRSAGGAEVDPARLLCLLSRDIQQLPALISEYPGPHIPPLAPLLPSHNPFCANHFRIVCPRPQPALHCSPRRHIGLSSSVYYLLGL